MKFLYLLTLLVLLATIAIVDAKSCPCGCKIKAKRKTARRSCKKKKFAACELQKCNKKGFKGLSCCDPVEMTPSPEMPTPEPLESPSSSPSASPSVSPSPSPMCPCKCMRKKQVVKKSCKGLRPICKVRKCGKEKFQCCFKN